MKKKKSMKKKGLIAALVLAMSLESVFAVYGADFSSGQQETAADIPMESVFSSVDDAITYEVPVNVTPSVEEVPTVPEETDPAEEVPAVPEENNPQEEPSAAPGENDPQAEPPEEADIDIFSSDISEEDVIPGETEADDAEIFTASDAEAQILSTEDFSYKIIGAEITIVSYIGKEEIVEIPEKIGEYPVKAIGENAFSGSTVKQLTLPESITSIHETAFASCTELVLYCYAGTYAEKYAIEKSIPYKLIEAKKTDIAAATVSMESSVICTGKALTPNVTVSMDGKTLVRDQDYTVDYTDNINPGTAAVNITGKGSYEGTIKKTFKITLATPQLVSAASASYRAVKVKWKAVPGAKSYNVYYKGGTVKYWKKIQAGVTGTSYLHTSSTAYPLVTGQKYTYTVKAVYDRTLSGCVLPGITATPMPGTVKLGTVKSVAYNKLKITWTKVFGASGYYVYRKSGNSWQRIGSTTSNSFIHTSSTKYPVKTGVTYTYTVRAYRNTGTKAVAGGCSKTGISGKTIPDTPVLVSAEYTDTGKITIRWKKAAGATNYLVYRKDTNGKWQRIANVKGANMVGYTHVSSAIFPIVEGKTYTYTVCSYTTTGKTWGHYDTKGKTVKAKLPELEEATLQRARDIVAKVTNSQMTSSQKLKACFDWVISKPYVTRRKFVNTPGWPAVYANDHFVLGGGNCHADASAFAYLAKALGYQNVYVCTDSDGTYGTPHSWTEINGLVYDPLFAEAKSYYRYYGVSYRTYELSAILRIAI